MKVIHICQSADPNIGGSLVVARSLAQAQIKQGVDAWICYLYASEYDLESEQCANQIFLRVERTRRYTAGMLMLWRIMRQIGADVVHHHDGLLWPRLVTVRLGVPLVTHGHLGSPRVGSSLFANLTHRYISLHTDRLIAITRWVSESWIDAGLPPEKIRVISNGVNIEHFHRLSSDKRLEIFATSQINPQSKVLLWVGRLDRITKGLDRLLAVARSLPHEWSLAIVGDGPDRNWLDEQLRLNVGEPRNCFLIGRVRDPSFWYGCADAFLFTSSIETFGLVILEAAASKLPILAFRCEGGGAELLAMLGARELDDDQLDDLENILSNLKGGQSLEDARSFVKSRFSWDRAARQAIGVYHELQEIGY